MNMNARHLIDFNSLRVKEWDSLIKMAQEISLHPKRYIDACHGKVLATLFYEPSTRTQMSFQTAMLRLGGRIIGFDNPGNTSVSKGESLKDTVRVVSGYADIIVLRHPFAGAAKAASFFSKAPIVNAGDGGHLHPTQTLTDLFTLTMEKGRLDNLCIGICGDLLNGRTVHSLIKAMSRFEGNRFIFISTPELAIPGYIKDILDRKNTSYREVYSLSEAIGELDVLYMTRIQQERLSGEEYEKQKGVFVLNGDKLQSAKPDLKILHPLPRVDEIDVGIDDDSRAVYFEQTEYGMYARMALIMFMLDNETRLIDGAPKPSGGAGCKNQKCITGSEIYLPERFYESNGKRICEYCDEACNG